MGRPADAVDLAWRPGRIISFRSGPLAGLGSAYLRFYYGMYGPWSEAPLAPAAWPHRCTPDVRHQLHRKAAKRSELGRASLGMWILPDRWLASLAIEFAPSGSRLEIACRSVAVARPPR